MSFTFFRILFARLTQFSSKPGRIYWIILRLQKVVVKYTYQCLTPLGIKSQILGI
jgi:hypothetical protein